MSALLIPERIVLLNGAIPAEIATVDGLTITSTMAGMTITVEKNTVIDQPIHLIYSQTVSQSHETQSLSLMIVAQENSQLTIFEEYIGKSDIHYANRVETTIVAKSDAHIAHYRLQNEGNCASHDGKISIDQSADSRVDTYHFNVGAKLGRHELHYRFLEKGASAKIIGLYAGHSKQQLSSHTLVDHIAPHCNSDQIYRGVLFDSSHGIFNGKIHVFPNAQKSAAFLNNRNLLLSQQAQVDTKPELEIDADDVKCSHGATVGSLDAQALFYLRSRGIDEQEARQLLIHAFLAELFEMLPNSHIQSYIESTVNNGIT